MFTVGNSKAPPEEATEPLEIPADALSPGALRGVVEAFVLREGTEYGARDYSLEEKVAQVLAQLQQGEARILFDPATEAVILVPRQQVRRQP